MSLPHISKSSRKSVLSRAGPACNVCFLNLINAFLLGFLNGLGMHLCQLSGHALKDGLCYLSQKKKMKLSLSEGVHYRISTVFSPI